MLLFQLIINYFFVGPPGPPGELPLLPPDILFQRDAPSSRYPRHKRNTDVSFNTSKHGHKNKYFANIIISFSIITFLLKPNDF